ncbi:6-phosphogluconate dehydrogenase NAD-binding [Beijerinckia indica subsp. indica ATCC 9039]|uniref:6-phosphogluconate dehydrogenase NAD-binding n=2 Tax=Beijerinckia TaxID=532 RepID=B2IG65_BEII9|nr:6-phosphogluconate dehydrogenase NAD-binding [Beijerinckia indica subsp. indica ATCC 9039]
MQLGFLGLGHMGLAIASNLLAAGHHVRAWNRSQEPLARLQAKGAEIVKEPVDALQGDALFSMLANDDAVRSVLIDSGALAQARKGLIHVNMATISVALAEELAVLHDRLGLAYVAAPVFGRPEAAASAKLHIVVAGAPSPVASIEPVLAALGQKIWPVGSEPKAANIVKIAGNFMIASMIETIGEAAALVQGHGVTAADFLDVMTNSLFAAPAYKTYGDLIARAQFEPAGFKLTLGLKDVRLALAAGEAAHVPLPLGSLLRDNFLDCIAHGESDKDWSALAGVAARRAGLDERDEKRPIA